MTFNAPGAASSGTYTNQATALTVTENPVPRNPVPRNPVPRNPVPRNPVPRNYVPEDGIPYTQIYGVKDYSLTVSADEAVPGDVGAYLALFNIDKAYKDSYVFQVFITKPTYAFEVVDGCEPQNRPLGTLVANISDPGNPVPRNPVPRNPVPRNPVPRNPAPSDALVQNSTFTLGSNEAGASGLRTAIGQLGLWHEREWPDRRVHQGGPARPQPGGRHAAGLSGQGDAAITRKFDPYGEEGAATPPSVVVADSTCTDASDPNCTFVAEGPDLAVASSTAAVSPTTVSQGAPVTFPSAVVDVTNQGTREPTDHKIGFYLSASTTIAGLPRNGDGTIQTDGAVYTKLLAAVPVTGTTDVAPTSLTIPASTPLGTYYLYAYVDSERVVSELDEDNNIVQGGPLTVVPPSTLALGPATLWIGLKNSDDQGTQFDLRTEVYVGTTLVSAGETRCITNVTRNASLAKEVGVPFGPVGPSGSGAVSLRVLTRIGTNPDGTKCSGPGGSHNNAQGLRLYYDATSRPSRFGAQIPPASSVTSLFLHSTGASFFLDGTAPAGSTAKYLDSAGLDCNGGNPWKPIGTWTRP